MEETIKNKIEDFLKNLDTEVEVLYYVDIDNIDLEDSFQSICSMIEDNQGFDSEIIYYSRAIEYLQENDPSLRNSLEIASEYGYEVSNLNSEILASLLASQNIREDFYKLEDEITEFFDEIREEIENLEELEEDE
jgi:intracellular sulfur oxidation DsrE/DsrF family protein